MRDIPDFPKEGILFRDIMPLLQDPVALRESVDRLVEYGTGKHIDMVLGAEARGFILGAAMAYGLGAGFVCARKPGKLPHTTISAEYELEYGTDSLEVHADAIKPGQNVLVHDDLLATGGTARAKIDLVEQLGGKVVGVAFIIELEALDGREQARGLRRLQPDQVLTPPPQALRLRRARRTHVRLLPGTVQRPPRPPGPQPSRTPPAEVVRIGKIRKGPFAILPIRDMPLAAAT